LKIQVPCNQCAHDFVSSGGKSLGILSFAKLSVTDDGIYELECLKGHRSVTTLSAERFEVLYEIGANAIIDGYYREAVSSFTSALERFYEYFLNLVSIEKNIPEETFVKTWKQVNNQSERQIGAFILVWVLETGAVPSALNDTWRGFRNNVIHKGKIPTEAEAVMYGSEILRLLHEGIDLVRVRYEEQRRIYMGRTIKKFPKDKYQNHVGGGMGISTIVSLHNRESPSTLEDGLTKIKEVRRQSLAIYGGVG